MDRACGARAMTSLKKTKTALLVSAAVILAGVAGYLLASIRQDEVEKVTVPEPRVYSLPSGEAAALVPYRNEEYGFELMFPDVWIALEKANTNKKEFAVGFFHMQEVDPLQNSLIEYFNLESYPLFYYDTTLTGYKTVYPPSRPDGAALIEPELMIVVGSYPAFKAGNADMPLSAEMKKEDKGEYKIDGQTIRLFVQECHKKKCGSGVARKGEGGFYAFTCNKNDVCLQILGKYTVGHMPMVSFIKDTILPSQRFFGGIFENLGK
jgi:hypothetical protein